MCVLHQVVWYPCLWIKGIWVVLQQVILTYLAQAISVGIGIRNAGGSTKESIMSTGSHRITVPSPLPVANMRPSGLKTMLSG